MGVLISAAALLALSALPRTGAALADGGNGSHLQAVPFTFVGRANDPNGCGNPYPAGSRIVTAAWLNGFGLPDDGTSQNTAAPKDPHSGLLLSKNGPTPDCSSAGVHITGLDKNSTISELGFDFRNGTHCGAGAPRYNITAADGSVYFAGCGDGTPSPAPQDGAQWTRVRFSNGQVFPAGAGEPVFAFGVTKVRSIEIIYDEGTDVPTTQDPNGVGLVCLDNLDIGGKLITSGPANAGNGDNGNGHGGNDNQGGEGNQGGD